MNVEQLYQEIILDHYKAKHHAGLRDPYEAQVTHVNPSCGDEILLRVHLEGERVVDVSYDAVGCSISQASTSVMTDLVIGRDIADAMVIATAFQEMMHSQGNAEPDEELLEDGIAFLGVSQFPARVKCALLGWSAWKDAVAHALAAAGSGATSERGDSEDAGSEGVGSDDAGSEGVGSDEAGSEGVGSDDAGSVRGGSEGVGSDSAGSDSAGSARGDFEHPGSGHDNSVQEAR